MEDKAAAEKNRRAMQSLKDKARNEALKKQNTQLNLEKLFKEVVSKHKNLTQNRPQVPALVNNKPSKKHKMRQNKQQQVPVHNQSVMQQIYQVISKLPPGLLVKQIPSTSAMTPEQSASQQPEPFKAITAPGQSVLQQPEPVAAITTGKSVLQQPGPFANVTPGLRLFQNPRPFAAMTPGHSVLQKSEAVALAIKKKRKRAKRGERGGVKNKKRQSFHQVNVVNVYNAGPSQFQAPHHDEPEDLTDDLAPNMSVQSVPQQPGSQPQAVTSENKLNFKFQKTAPKNPDWSEYQNKFRRIGGASPDSETAEADKEVKQEPMKDRAINTGSASVNRHPEGPTTAGQNQAAAQKVVIQKVEILKPGKTDIPLKPIQVRCANTPNFQPNANMYTFPATPESFDYPKGIPKTFFVQDKRNQEPQAPPNLPHLGIQKQMLMQDQYYLPNTAYGFPAGIPKSFVIKERLQEAALMCNPPEMNPDPDYAPQSATYVDLPSWILPGPAPKPLPLEIYEGVAPSRGNAAYPQPEPIPDRAYSPSDAYSEPAGRVEEEFRDGSESPDLLQSGQKRLSAFKRLGPLTQPKKPKLTINLMLNKEQAVREVVDETDDSYRFVPVHLRKDIITSSDETVVKYLPFWPWKKNMVLRKTVSARFSKSVMILEQEQMETGYEKDSLFIQVSVKGYPKTWTKEDVLDAVLECVKGKSFIPSFIDFTPKECKFLVIRCRAALVAIHKVGFCIRKDDVELMVSISLTDTSLNQIDLIPRLVLRKRLMSQYDGEKALDLQEFLIEKDVSHFVYFPLSRVTNQMELVQLQSAVSWEHLTELNLSHNRLTSIDGFNLTATTPRLKHLDLSHNYLDKLTMLIRLRDLPLQSLKLEGNPLCHDYTDSAHYIKVVRMIFSGIKELDGVRIVLKGDLPPPKRNYCPEAAVPVVEKFLEVFFPLLETPYDDRSAIEDLYDKDAVMTITYRYKLRYGSAYRYFRHLFARSRSLKDNYMESVKGAPSISSLIGKWPAIEHDRYTITVDVMHHDDSTTVFRVGGVLKVTADTLAEDEHLLTFTRNIVLHTRNGAEYKIQNEMLYWDVPCEEAMRDAFNITTVRPKQLSIKLESPPDKDLKSKLVDIFVKLADIDKKRGARCLELKNWDLRSALEYYVSLLKLDDLAVLSQPKKHTTPVSQAS